MKNKIFADGDVINKRWLRRFTFQHWQNYPVNQTDWVFNDYENKYCYQLMVAYQIGEYKLQGMIEIPYGLDDEYILTSNINDFAKTSSNIIQFNLKTKQLTIKNWDQNKVKIDKVSVYRREWEII